MSHRTFTKKLFEGQNMEDVIKKLPHDLVCDILSRLSVRILSRFRCVSKQWRNIISDPYFISLHHAQSMKNPCLLLTHCSDYYKNNTMAHNNWYLSSTDLNGKLQYELLASYLDSSFDMLPSPNSSTSLLCFTSDKANQAYVCNPSTQEFVCMPKPSPCVCPYNHFAFGFLPLRNEHVLIHLFHTRLYHGLDFDIGCEVLTISNGGASGLTSWRQVEKKCPYQVQEWGVLVNGAFHWINLYDEDYYDDKIIISFDIEEERFRTIDHPQSCSVEQEWFLHLVQLRGFLCLVDRTNLPKIDIWMLKDYKNQVWIKEYSICAPGCGYGLNETDFFQYPLEHPNNGDLLIYSNRKSLDAYDIEAKSFCHLADLTGKRVLDLSVYTESFFFLGSK